MDDIVLYNTTSNGNYNLIMAYPNIEEFALSSLGYLWLNKIASETDGVSVQRVSTDKTDVNSKNIDALAFSISFDFDFMGIFEILEKLKIPFDATDRNKKQSGIYHSPIIFAGGPVITTNPVPYEKFFDFMLIGDGEETFNKVLDILKLRLSKAETIERVAEIDGVYVPNKKVKRANTPLNRVIYTPIVTDKSYFKNTFIIEIARGCMNRCAFCTASYTNLPFRYYQYEKIIKAIDIGLKYTDKIAFLGAQISAHPQFEEIMDYVKTKMDKCECKELGISSLRTDAISPKVVQILVQGGQRHSTIAIEAASQRLRKFINKNLSEEQIIYAVKTARENGLKGLKIYSMLGIPTETEDDIKEFLRLAKILKEENKGFGLEFSFSTFVPKPQTPLQWSKREDTKSLEKKQSFLQKELSKIGVNSVFSSAKWDYWQTVLSRGDRSISDLMIYVYNNGGKIGAYKSGIKELSIDISKFVNGFDINDTLPWDNIELYPSKEQLKNEFKRLSKYAG